MRDGSIDRKRTNKIRADRNQKQLKKTETARLQAISNMNHGPYRLTYEEAAEDSVQNVWPDHPLRYTFTGDYNGNSPFAGLVGSIEGREETRYPFRLDVGFSRVVRTSHNRWRGVDADPGEPSILGHPRLVRNRPELEAVIDELTDPEIWHHLDTLRLAADDSEDMLYSIERWVAWVYPVQGGGGGRRIGCAESVPEEYQNRRGLISFGGPKYRDNKCFWRCLDLQSPGLVPERATESDPLEILAKRFCSATGPVAPCL